MKKRNNITCGKKNLDYYLKLPYTVIMVPEEAGGFFANIKELPGCMTQGETIDETLKNIEEAKYLWLKTALEMKLDIPLPPLVLDTIKSPV